MKPKISLITFGVRDLDRMIAFYRDGLGLPLHNYKPGDDMVISFEGLMSLRTKIVAPK